MLLALDAGNSNITIGAFEGAQADLRNGACAPSTNRPPTNGASCCATCSRSPASISPRVDGIIISSVVPPIDATLAAMARALLPHRGRCSSTPRTDLGLTIRYDNPDEVGADRLVNGVAGFHKYGGPCVMVRSGHHHQLRRRSRATANIWAASSPSGIGISIDALFSRTARLPMVDFRPPDEVIGTNTVASMQSGLYYGAIGMIDGILERMIAEARARNQSHRHRRPGAPDRRAARAI